MSAISALCKQVLYLDTGHKQDCGATEAVVTAYHDRMLPAIAPTPDLRHVERYGNGQARFTEIRVEVVGRGGEAESVFRTGDDLRIVLELTASEQVVDANVAIILYDPLGLRLVDANTALQGLFLTLEPNGSVRVEFVLCQLLLKPGQYSVGLWMGKRNVCDIDGITYAARFTVEQRAEDIHYDQVFPGPYQCRFQVRVTGIACKQ